MKCEYELFATKITQPRLLWYVAVSGIVSHICPSTDSALQRSPLFSAPGLVKFVPAEARLFCLALPGSFLTMLARRRRPLSMPSKDLFKLLVLSSENREALAKCLFPSRSFLHGAEDDGLVWNTDPRKGKQETELPLHPWPLFCRTQDVWWIESWKLGLQQLFL